MLKKCANFFQQNRIYFFSSVFLVPKKESGYHPMIKLKNLNHCISFTHFKMEVLLKEMLQERDCMFKIDLKDAHFSVPLYQKSKKFESFNWKDLFYQILCSCFGLGPAGSKDLHKVPISHIEKATPTIDHISGRYTDQGLLKRGNGTCKGYSDIYSSEPGVLMNVSKSSIPAISKFAVSGLEMNSADMTLTFPKEKKAKIVQQHQDLLGKIPASIKELSQLNSRLASTAAVEGNWELQFTNNHVHESVSRTKLVGAKPSLDKQKSNTFGILSRAQN